jgi:hypothetical protein
MSLKEPDPQAQQRPEEKRPYERPAIVWREPYEPMSFGVSCAKQPGNPGCGPGPFSG